MVVSTVTRTPELKCIYPQPLSPHVNPAPPDIPLLFFACNSPILSHMTGDRVCVCFLCCCSCTETSSQHLKSFFMHGAADPSDHSRPNDHPVNIRRLWILFYFFWCHITSLPGNNAPWWKRLFYRERQTQAQTEAKLSVGGAVHGGGFDFIND